MAAVFGALLALGCAAEEHTVIVRFDPESLAAHADEVELTVVRACREQAAIEEAGFPVRPLRRSKLERTKKPGLGEIEADKYGLYAVAIADGCRFAAGCTDIALGGNSRNLIVVIEYKEASGCVLPTTDAGVEDSGPEVRDAGPGPEPELSLSFNVPAEEGLITDESENEFVGSLRNDAVLTEDGHTGGALHLVGKQSVLEFGAVLPLTEAISVEAWIRPELQTGWATIVNRFYSNTGYWLGMSRNGVGVEFWIDVTFAAASPVPVDEWTHVVGTFDATTGGIILYVNGNAVGGASHPSPVGVAQTPLSIGNRPTTVFSPDFFPFTGDMDDVRVYDVVLSREQVCANAGGTWDGLMCVGGGDKSEE